MRGSIRLFSVFGISIYVHITFLILPLLFYLHAGLKGVFLILFVFSCVTAHELFHSITAKKFGVKVRGITLFPIGGVASISSFPEKPIQEFLIALAGPAFNIAFAAILFYPLLYILGAEVLFSPSFKSWPNTFAYAFWINPFLALFNLLPAFPMDGGRILRSVLARRFTLKKATHIAVTIGHFFALVFGFLGIVYGHIFLIIIAIFIYMAAASEGQQVDIRESIKGFYVKDVLAKSFLVISPEATLGTVMDIMLKIHQEDFPVVENERLVGLLTRREIIMNLHRGGANLLVSEIMTKNFPVAKSSDSLLYIQKKMMESQLKAIPVVDAGELKGVVTLEDVSRVYSVMTERAR